MGAGGPKPPDHLELGSELPPDLTVTPQLEVVVELRSDEPSDEYGEEDNEQPHQRDTRSKSSHAAM